MQTALEVYLSPFSRGAPVPQSPLEAVLGTPLALGAVVLAVSWLYQALMESSRLQATLGKLAVGIAVTDLSGRRVSFARASGRFWATWMFGLPTAFWFPWVFINLVDYLAVAVTPRRQAIHDLVTRCLVVERGSRAAGLRYRGD